MVQAKKLSSYFKKGKNYAKESNFGMGNRFIRRIVGKKPSSTKYYAKKLKNAVSSLYSRRVAVQANVIGDTEDIYIVTSNKPALVGAILDCHVVTNAKQVDELQKKQYEKGIFYKYRMAKLRVTEVEREGDKFLLLMKHI